MNTPINNKFDKVSESSFKQRGFSLLELLVVIVVIGIIAAITVPRLQRAVVAANQGSAVSAIRLITNLEVAVVNRGEDASTIDQLIAAGALDEAFADEDNDPNTGERSGYKFMVTKLANQEFVVSAIPASSSLLNPTGKSRYGTSLSGVIYSDAENLDTHFTALNDFNGGTVTTYQP